MLFTSAKQWLLLMALMGMVSSLANCASVKKTNRQATHSAYQHDKDIKHKIRRLEQEIRYESNKLKAIDSHGSSLWSVLKKVKRSGLDALSKTELYRLDGDDFELVQGLSHGSLLRSDYQSGSGGTAFFLEGYSGITGVAIDDMKVRYVGQYTYTTVQDAPKTVLKFKVFIKVDALESKEVILERIRTLEAELEALQEEHSNRRKSY